MNTDVVLKALEDSWFAIKERLATNYFFNTETEIANRYTHIRKCQIRKWGSERYIQALLFQELFSKLPVHLHISVEANIIKDSKKPDIVIFNKKNGFELPEALIELKNTGYYLLNKEKNRSDFFLNDLSRYYDYQFLQENGTILFYEIYYESNKNEILDIINDRKSVLQQLLENNEEMADKLKVKKENLYEGYGFIGDFQNWQFLKSF